MSRIENGTTSNTTLAELLANLHGNRPNDIAVMAKDTVDVLAGMERYQQETTDVIDNVKNIYHTAVSNHDQSQIDSFFDELIKFDKIDSRIAKFLETEIDGILPVEVVIKLRELVNRENIPYFIIDIVLAHTPQFLDWINHYISTKSKFPTPGGYGLDSYPLSEYIKRFRQDLIPTAIFILEEDNFSRDLKIIALRILEDSTQLDEFVQSHKESKDYLLFIQYLDVGRNYETLIDIAFSDNQKELLVSYILHKLLNNDSTFSKVMDLLNSRKSSHLFLKALLDYDYISVNKEKIIIIMKYLLKHVDEIIQYKLWAILPKLYILKKDNPYSDYGRAFYKVYQAARISNPEYVDSIERHNHLSVAAPTFKEKILYYLIGLWKS